MAQRVCGSFLTTRRWLWITASALGNDNKLAERYIDPARNTFAHDDRDTLSP